MRTKAAFLVIAGLLWSSSATAESRWIRIKSEHFEMNTTAGEGSARETLKYFEQVRGFFIQALGEMKGNQLPVSIIAFNSAKEFEPYKINGYASAFYQAGAEREYIVMSEIGQDYFPVAVHEYVHLLARHAGLDFPPWLNEGIADVYSTLKPSGKDIMVGTPPAGRLNTARNGTWVPLSVILAADRSSAYYNEKNKAGSLYSEGWALTHMLMLSDAYRRDFSKVTAALAANKTSEQALTEAYGKPLAKIESDLQNYLRQTTVRVSLFPAKLEKITAPLIAERLNPFEVKLRLADVQNRRNNEKAARQAVVELIAEQPQRSEPYVMLGYLDWRDRQVPEALKNFEKALELGSHNPKMMWDYARLLESKDRVEALRILHVLLAEEPARTDLRLEIGRLQLAARDHSAALATLSPVKKVDKKEAPQLFHLLMYAELGNGNRDGAKNAAERLIQFSEDESEREAARQIIKRVENPAPLVAMKDEPFTRIPVVRSDPETSEDERPTQDEKPASEQRPALRRGEEPLRITTQEAPASEWPSISGSFIELICMNDKATVVLQMAEGQKKRYLIQNPNQVVVNSSKGATLNLACGVQKPVKISIEFTPPPKPDPNIDGIVRVLTFED